MTATHTPSLFSAASFVQIRHTSSPCAAEDLQASHWHRSRSTRHP
jgi:hypothetical protein